MGSHTIKAYVDRATEILLKVHPDWDADETRKYVKLSITDQIKSPTIIIENNTKGLEKSKNNLIGICDWIDDTKPIIAGNATFYCQPEVMKSPSAAMLKDMKTRRSAIKKEMFLHEPGSDMYIALELESGNIKVIMNANYGASANKAAAFYNEYSPAAITLFAQSVITTNAAFFEGFCGDNQKFYHIDECMDWISHVIKKDKKIDSWIVIPTHEEVYQKLLKHFISISVDDCKFLRAYVNTLSKKERVYVYYANNVRDLIYRHSEVSSLINDMLIDLPQYSAGEVPPEFQKDILSVPDWNRYVSKAMFLDPYGVPDIIKSNLEEFHRLCIKYVFVEYLTPDSIAKLNNHERNTVLLVDTDSNAIYLWTLVEFILKTVLQNKDYGREKMYNEIIIISMITSLLSKAIDKVLNYYGIRHNINEEARKELSMKNEFLWVCFFVMQLKKHYGALVAMREGNISIPFRLDIKGMDFIKAAVSEEVSNRFTNMLTTYILYPELSDDPPNLRGLMCEIKSFEKEIDNDLKNGGLKYFKTQVYKPMQAYAKKANAKGEMKSIAWTQQVFRGSEVWNLIEDEHKISWLDRVCIVKTTIESIQDLSEMMDKFPEVYSKILHNVYGNGNPEITKTGMSVICIPPSIEKIPEWLIPYVNRELVISDTIASFNSVLETFGVRNVSFKTPNGGKAKKISGLISL